MTRTDTGVNLAIYRETLAVAAAELERLGTHAIARPLTTGGWAIDVHQADRAEGNPAEHEATHMHVDSMESMPGAFPPASASARLIENGWIISSPAMFAAGRMGGWLQHEHTDVYTAPITRTWEGLSWT